MNTSLPTTLGAIAVAALLAGTAVPAATAKGGDRFVSAAAKCSPGVTGKIKAKPDDGLLEVEFEVDQNRRGVRWTWAMRRNGVTVRRGVSRTVAPSGSFSVERRIGNPSGVDRIAFRAVSSGGKVCTGVVRV